MKHRFWTLAAATGLVVTAFVSPALGQNSRVGPTFSVNRFADLRSNGVRYTDVSWDSVNHVYLVVWGGFGQILGRFVTPDGQILGTDPFVITAPASGTDYKDAPRVAYSPDTATFMVVWRDDRVNANLPQVWGRSLRYQDTSGVPQFLGPDFTVTNAFVSVSDPPTIEYATGSRLFLVVYQFGADLHGRRFTPDGTLIGTEIQIANSGDLEWQGNLTYNPSSDEFFVIWKFYSDAFVAGAIQGRRVQAGSGDVLGAPIDLEPMTYSDLGVPSVAFDQVNNRYLTIWYKAFGSVFSIQGRLVNGDGSLPGSRFSVAPTGNYVDLDVAYSTRTGTFFSVFAHHDILEIFGAGVSAAGVPDPMMQVTNTLSTSGTDYGRVASATDRDEWLVTNNIWWDKATAQRLAYSSSGVSFSKQAPVNGTGGQTGTVNLTWDTVAGASGYQVCIDTTQNSTCDTAWSTTTSTSFQAVALANGTYNWQVRAITGSGTTEANAGGWWNFTVGGSAGVFGKLTPSNGVSGVGTSVTLTWAPIAGSTYQVCIDVIDNNSCDTAWQSVSSTSMSTTLATGTYFWQVRGQVNGVWVLADSGTSWQFTVGAPTALFGKSSPTNSATGVPGSLTLTWGSIASSTYQVCIDTIDNNSCDTRWQSVSVTSMDVTGLATGLYSWQVRGQVNSVWVLADNGNSWTFTVGSAAGTPASFGKASPLNGASGLTDTVTLTWAAVANAGYRVCVDTVNNNACDTGWYPNGGGTSRLVSGLTPGTYYWQARAETGTTSSDADSGTWWSFTVGGTSTPTPSPTPVATVLSTAKQSPASGASGLGSSVTLQWAAVADAGYWVCFDTVNNNACDGSWWPNGGGTSRLLSGLAPGTYYWQVRTQTTAGTSDADSGAWWSFTVGGTPTPSPTPTPTPTPPPPPSGGSLAKQSPSNGISGLGSSVALQWAAVADAGYWICFDTTNNNACDGGWYPNGGGTSRLLSGLAPGTYYWQLRAQTPAGTSDADAGTWWSFTVGAPTSSGSVAKQSPGSGSFGSNTSVTLQWSTLANAGYWVCFDVTNNNSCDTTWWPNGGGNTRVLTGLAPGTYYWQVRADTGSGAVDADSGMWWSFTVTAPSTLTKLAPANGGTLTGTVNFQWSPVSDAGYWVCVDTINNGACDTAWYPNGGGTSRQLNGLAPGTYYWQVRAQTATGMADADGGAWSSFTITGAPVVQEVAALEPATTAEPGQTLTDAFTNEAEDGRRGHVSWRP